MANIYVGFHDRKSCNRILKPPGGGTSDIFNTSSEVANEPVKVKDTSTVISPETTPSSTPIKEEPSCPLNGMDSKNVESNVQQFVQDQNSNKFSENIETPNVETLSINDENKNEEVQQKSVEEKSENIEVKKTQSESISCLIHDNNHKEIKVTTPEKKASHRVPPGGYSSGLW